jgi:hypothetical protein
MSETMQHADTSSETSTQSGAAFANQPVFEAMTRTLAWQEEMMRFTAARMRRDAELGQALVSARNWADAVKLQQEWASSVIHDYTQEAKRLLEIASSVGSEIGQSADELARAGGDVAQNAMQSAAEAGRAATDAATELARGATARAESAGTQAAEAGSEAVQRATSGVAEATRSTTPPSARPANQSGPASRGKPSERSQRR